MAVAFDLATTNDPGNSASESYSHTCTGSERFIAVVITMDNNTTTGTAVTYGGFPLHLARRRADASLSSVEIWVLANPPSGSNTVAITLSGSVNHGSTALSLTGVHQTRPIGTTTDSIGNATTQTTTIGTRVDNSWVIAGLNFNNTGGTPSVTGTNQTQRSNFVAAFALVHATSTQTATSAAGYTSSWSTGAVSSTYVQVLVEVMASTGPSTKLNTLRPAVFAPGLAR